MSWVLPLALVLLILIGGVLFRVNIGLIMLVNSLLIILFYRLPPVEILRLIYLTITSRVTLILFFSIIMLQLLGHLLKETGAMQKMIDSLGGLLGDWRLLMAALAAVIGLMTVPGGAIISAPMIDEAGRKTGFTPAGQAAANFWFRHILYFSLPLFPSMVLAAELAGVKVTVFARYNWPLTVAGAALAFYTIFKQARGLPTRLDYGRGKKEIQFFLKQFIFNAAPILATLFLVAFFQVLFPLAILAGIIVAFCSHFPKKSNRWNAFKDHFAEKVLPGIRFKTALIILAIMFFKYVLDCTHLVGSMAEYLLGIGAPVIVLMFIIPFSMGMLTGDNSPSIAIVIPLFASFLDPGAPGYLSQLSFIYFSSTLGHLFTPMHPCLVLTGEYFKVGFGRMLRPLLGPAFLVIVLALGEVIWLGHLL